jgi:AcrR family transcriptional regulator
MAGGEPPPKEGEAPLFHPDALTDLPAELALGQLPPGRHGLPRSFVVRNQRLRIVAALLRVLPRNGYANTTIAHITQEAGVSRAAFYGQFASKEECFLEAYDLAGEWLRERIVKAADGGDDWPSRVRARVEEALRLLAANPFLARLIAVEVLAAGPSARERQQACLASLAEVLRDGRPPSERLPTELEEMLLGGVVATIGRYVDANRIDQLPTATAELVQYLLIPYLAPEETRRIARAA